MAPPPPPPPRILPGLAPTITRNGAEGKITIQDGGLDGLLKFHIGHPGDLFPDQDLRDAADALIVDWVEADPNDVGMGARLLYWAADYAERQGVRWIMINSSIKNNFYFSCGFRMGPGAVGDINLVAATLAVRHACAQIRVRKTRPGGARQRYLPGQYQ